MTIKLKFEQEGDIKRVSYLTPRNIFGYIFLFITYLIMLLIIYLFLLQNSKSIPLYFHIMMIALLILSYLPKKITLIFNVKDKILLAKVIGVGGFLRRKYSYEDLKKTEFFPKNFSKVLKISLIYGSKLLTQKQVYEIAKYFDIKSDWLNNSLGTEPRFGIPIKK